MDCTDLWNWLKEGKIYTEVGSDYFFEHFRGINVFTADGTLLVPHSLVRVAMFEWGKNREKLAHWTRLLEYVYSKTPETFLLTDRRQQTILHILAASCPGAIDSNSPGTVQDFGRLFHLLFRANPTATKAFDKFGNIPLHCAVREYLRDKKKIIYLWLLLKDPETASVRDRCGRTALYRLITNLKLSVPLLEFFYKVKAFESFGIPSQKMQLYPFQVAAVMNCGVDEIYMLLRECPHLIQPR